MPAVVMLLLMPFIVAYVIYKSCKDNRKAKENERRRQAEIEAKEAERKKRLEEREAERLQQLAFFRENVFPMDSNDDAVNEIWRHWKSELHDTDEQLRRQVEAIYEAFPICIDGEAYSGYCGDFLCIIELYQTSLLKCSCKDYEKSNMPCKHMYRLYFALTTNSEKDSGLFISDELLHKFSQLSKKQKVDFIGKIQRLGRKGVDYYKDSDLLAEIRCGLLDATDEVDYAPLLNRMTKDEIIIALEQAGIEDVRPSWSKAKIVAWVVENHTLFLKERFKNHTHIIAADEVSAWGEMIAELHRASTITHPTLWEDVCQQRKKDMENDFVW